MKDFIRIFQFGMQAKESTNSKTNKHLGIYL